VRTLRGDRVALDVDGTATMAQLKAMVMAREGVTVGAQRLFFAGDGLPVVAHYGVRQGSVVFLSLQLRADDDASQYVLARCSQTYRPLVSISLGPTDHSIDMEGRRCVACKRDQSNQSRP